MTISCGSIGFEGAAPMLRKKEPSGFNRRRICPAHSPHQSKYDRRSCRSEYRLYLIPRLYGGDVTASSTVSPASRDIPVMQSCRRRSNLVTKRSFASIRVSYKRKLTPGVRFLGSTGLLTCSGGRVGCESGRHAGGTPASTGDLPGDVHSRISVNSLIFLQWPTSRRN